MALEASAKEIAMYANGVCSAISFFVSRPIFRSACQKTDAVIGPILFSLKEGLTNMSQPQSNGLLERLFHLSEHNTTVRRECLAGLTTFVSMAYILFVNPIILGDAGMDPGAVFTATALSAIMGCLLMGFLANYPIAIAPGLGDNAFFTYSIVLAMGMPWQQAMGGVFIASILFTLVSLFKLREIIIDAIPQESPPPVKRVARRAAISLYC